MSEQVDTALHQKFQAIYKQFSEKGLINFEAISSLEPEAHAFFGAHINDEDPGRAADQFFNYFGDLWTTLVQQRLYDYAERLWSQALVIARSWEDAHQPQLLHKGTAFYFLGGTTVLQGNVRKGFLLIHASLNEDRRKHHIPNDDPDTPALKFVTLDSRTDTQFFLELVKEGADELEQRLTTYRSQSGSNLQFTDVQNRFARQYAVRETVFILTMSIFEVLNLRKSAEQAGRVSEFGAQLCANCLFDLCQVVEEAIRAKSGRQGAFQEQAQHLSRIHSWPTSHDPLGLINGQQRNAFDTTVRDLVANTAVAHRAPVSLLERDLWLTYVVRNSAAHSLVSKLVLQEHFEEIYQSIMNTLFTVVDKLYP